MRPFLTLHHPAAARRYYAQGSWREQTLYHLLAGHAAARPDEPAARDAARTLTWGELLAWVDGTAAHLHGLGLDGGDRVSIWMNSRLEVLVAFLACARERIACNPSLHRTHRAADVAALITALGSKLLLAEPGWGADRLADPVAHFSPSAR